MGHYCCFRIIEKIVHTYSIHLTRALIMQSLQGKASISKMREPVTADTRVVSQGDSYQPWVCSLSIFLSCNLLLTNAIDSLTTPEWLTYKQYSPKAMCSLLAGKTKCRSLLFSRLTTAREERVSYRAIIDFPVSFNSASRAICRVYHSYLEVVRLWLPFQQF